MQPTRWNSGRSRLGEQRRKQRQRHEDSVISLLQGVSQRVLIFDYQHGAFLAPRLKDAWHPVENRNRSCRRDDMAGGSLRAPRVYKLGEEVAPWCGYGAQLQEKLVPLSERAEQVDV
jgi:hypothetical protein